MKLAIASENDFKLFWSMHRAQQWLEYADFSVNPVVRRERCEKVILGRMAQLGGGFSRVVMGCQLLIEHCCDKSLDHYDLSPKLKSAIELYELQQGATEATAG